MNIALWSGQILLAFVFLVSGTFKSLWSKERLVASGQTGVQFFPQPVIRMVAACELLAVVGITLPWLTVDDTGEPLVGHVEVSRPC